MILNKSYVRENDTSSKKNLIEDKEKYLIENHEKLDILKWEKITIHLFS